MEKPDYFFGLEPHWFTRDRLYMVFVTREALCGAFVAGQLYDEEVARLQLQQVAPFLGWWVRRLVAARKVREAEYAAMNPLSGEFLHEDRRNFCIFGKQILDVVVRRKASVWAPGSVGQVRMTLATGEVRKLILIKGQDPDAVAAMLRRVCADVKIDGDAPPPVPKSVEESRKDTQRMRFYVLCCAAFAMFGAGLAFVSLRNGHNPGLWGMAMFNLLGSVYCGVRAARSRKPTSHDTQAELLRNKMQHLNQVKTL